MANQEHLDILAKGVEAWNAWRGENPIVVPDLSYAELANRALAVNEPNLDKVGINLSGAILRGAILEGAVLVFATLKGADLTWANCSVTNLYEANLEGAFLFEANLERAYLLNANLNAACLVGADLNCTDLNCANLSCADLRWANLRGANLSRADLKEANLKGANLSEGDLEGADLKNADLTSTNLENANVAGVKFNGKALYEGIRVDSCYGSQMFKTFAMDQNYIEEFRNKSKWNRFLYRLWLVTSNCGRSMLLWAAWSAVLLAIFAWVYHLLGHNAFVHPTSVGSPPPTPGTGSRRSTSASSPSPL
ncbi:pentapeptide repeat-containing protein [Fundidesulfovibrio putealis]|uniref:pentapeptide repeat-containing protein n=1 Tax=Fundidesulfovibrio putealis TaxID=270496 RepID=UPI000418EFAD|nr:pentapeptide repeat-containing protein [Fundidesulfovibrio putealis]